MINSEKYINSVRDWLKEQGRYKEPDELSLELLREDIELYNGIVRELENGITVKGKPSPYLRMKNQIEGLILESSTNLGLTPKARKRLAMDVETVRTDIDDILEGLV